MNNKELLLNDTHTNVLVHCESSWVGRVATFIGLLFLLITSSKLSIPLIPVPATLQTFAVLLIPMIAGFQMGVITISSYLLLGALGFPVFAEANAGLPVLFGPTFGFLFGFLAAASVTGILTQYVWGASRIAIFVSACVGTAIIYLFGALGLSFFMNLHQAFLVGIKPFLLFDGVKILLLTFTVPFFWRKNFAD